MSSKEILEIIEESGCRFGLRHLETMEWVKLAEVLGQKVWVTSAKEFSFFTEEEAKKAVVMLGLFDLVEIEDAVPYFRELVVRDEEGE